MALLEEQNRTRDVDLIPVRHGRMAVSPFTFFRGADPRAHARSGDAVAIAAYLGKSDRFAQAIAAFSRSYADQNARDYAEFTDAIASGRLESVEGL